MKRSPQSQILLGDNLERLKQIPTASCRLIYIDPPFNTQKIQKRDRISVTRNDEAGTRAGFAGARYAVERLASLQYADQFNDFTAFLPRGSQRLTASSPRAAPSSSTPTTANSLRQGSPQARNLHQLIIGADDSSGKPKSTDVAAVDHHAERSQVSLKSGFLLRGPGSDLPAKALGRL